MQVDMHWTWKPQAKTSSRVMEKGSGHHIVVTIVSSRSHLSVTRKQNICNAVYMDSIIFPSHFVIIYVLSFFSSAHPIMGHSHCERSKQSKSLKLLLFH